MTQIFFLKKFLSRSMFSCFSPNISSATPLTVYHTILLMLVQSLLFIFFCFICLLDIVFLLWGEIISWSLMGAKGLTIDVTQIVPWSYLMGNINMRRTGNTILRYGNGANPNPHKTPSCKNCRAVYKCIFL